MKQQRGFSESPAMRSSEAATGIPSRMQASSISTTTTPTIATTTSASADPRNKCLDAGTPDGRKTLGRKSPGAAAPKARQHAQPKTAALPTGVAAGRGNRITLDCTNIIFAHPSPKLLIKGLKNGKYRTDFDGLYKRCCRCRDYWPADSEFYYANKNMPDGLSGFCKACYLERRYPNGRNNEVEEQAA